MTGGEREALREYDAAEIPRMRDHPDIGGILDE